MKKKTLMPYHFIQQDAPAKNQMSHAKACATQASFSVDGQNSCSAPSETLPTVVGPACGTSPAGCVAAATGGIAATAGFMKPSLRVMAISGVPGSRLEVFN